MAAVGNLLICSQGGGWGGCRKNAKWYPLSQLNFQCQPTQPPAPPKYTLGYTHTGHTHTLGYTHTGYIHTLGIYTHWVYTHTGYTHTLGIYTHWIYTHTGYTHTGLHHRYYKQIDV